MKIMSLNVNSFNGDKESLEEFKKTKVKYEYDNKWSSEVYNDVLSRWDNISKSD